MRKILIGLSLLILLCGSLVWKYYGDIFNNNINIDVSGYELYIEKGQTFDTLFKKLQSDSILIDPNTFEWVAGLMNYKSDKIASGRYLINSPLSNKGIITKLRAGWQDPVNITINNVRNLSGLSGKLAKNLLMDSIQIQNEISQLILKNDSIDSATFISYFIPNTYEVYWDISSQELWQRMMLEHQKYWNNDARKSKLNKLGLTANEVYTMASIVEKETNKAEEKSIIAGVYLNRLKRNIKLQADPTVVFANQNFKLRRILNVHLKIDSPYNTYKYAGLPPGPICMPSLLTLEAVLDAEDHEYIFFCAEPGYRGKHAFAKTHRGHINNANRYRAWLKEEGIR